MQTLEASAPESPAMSDSISEEEMAAFLDGRLEGPARERVQATLARDPAARREFVELSRLLSGIPSEQKPRSWWMPSIATLAAAAAVAAIVITTGRSAAPRGPISSERTNASHVAQISLVYPSETAAISPDSQHFIWRGIEGATYRITVSDEAGSTLLQENTTDTTLNVSEAITEKGNYFWTVDALLADGSSVTSGVQEFVVADR